ncbi:hypothetical protein C7457_1442 [Thermovibrio guaymasensis]|uniref:Cell division protein ZapA n=1 Tax=Thermovibrio guaymasensis TaxID=240167 RepID=A0A420W626_9BACT|nr:DUF6447 family protein [Thermovibrio guaymasensis]RKQ60619.1 hypothetical protein C7457_1442 [Thermovibrio guaymasensis]
MAEVIINGKKYEIEKLPKEAVDLINSIKFVDNELLRLQNQIKVNLAAKNFYFQQLQAILSKLEKGDSSEKISFE